MFQTPILFIVYKRPEITRQSFHVLQQVKPKILYIAADGPKQENPEEISKCAEVRAIVSNVDWDCEVHYDFSDVNLGLRKRIVSGINWIFNEHVTAIILEDDCIADRSFFPFCENLLQFYKDDHRIMVISGDNFQRKQPRTIYSYYFSRYNHCWGWATWKRAWSLYDDRMELWLTIRDNGWLEDILQNDHPAIKYWEKIFDKVYFEKINSWAFRWTFACWVNSGLTILPNKNLVQNIGFGIDASNTWGGGYSEPAYPMQFPLLHPPFVIRDARADQFTQKRIYSPNYFERLKRKYRRCLNRLHRK